MDAARAPSVDDNEYRTRAGTWDPYDPWTNRFTVSIRRSYYAGRLAGRLGAVVVGLADWLAPGVLRNLLRCQRRVYPITISQIILAEEPVHSPAAALNALLACAVPDRERFGQAWGLGFPWMSKNGLYEETVPFITHTPYAMEALLKLGRYDETSDDAMRAFDETWRFLESLLTLHRDDCSLALSYAPVPEPRIVVNANAYAAYAYALHASRGRNPGREAQDRAAALVHYVVSNQRDDGSWWYYADDISGNFIDCFHTCFVIKNLIKTARLLPAVEPLTSPAVESGKAYLERHFLDSRHRLVRRFTERDIKDPFVWDLYDQAEYMGLLVETGEYESACEFRDTVRTRFQRDGELYARIDVLGRRWGKHFLRWGIVPFLYYESRLNRAVN